MELRTRQEREEQLSLEQRQSVSQQGLCVHVCVFVSVHKSVCLLYSLSV